MKIHRYWTGDKPKPAYAQMLGTMASRFGEVIEWNDENLPKMTKALVDKYESYAPNTVKQKSNVARLGLLYEFGGLWIDYDLMLLSLPYPLERDTWVASDSQMVCSCAMQFHTPKNPILLQAIESITEQDTAWASSGEKMLDAVFVDIDKKVLPFLMSGTRNVNADMWAVHLWSHRWEE